MTTPGGRARGGGRLRSGSTNSGPGGPRGSGPRAGSGPVRASGPPPGSPASTRPRPAGSPPPQPRSAGTGLAPITPRRRGPSFLNPPVGWATLISILGLIAVAIASLSLFGGATLPGVGAEKTPTPSNVVIVDPRSNILGSLAYVKAGNVWIQTGEMAHQLTTNGHDSMPAWSPDGASVYFIRSVEANGSWVINGARRTYDLEIPSLMRIAVSGGVAEQILSGRIAQGKNVWSYFIREPAISPDGLTAAVMSDGPDPSKADSGVVLKLLDLAAGTLTDLGLPEDAPLGHQDPAWSPDGTSLLYVRNARDGTRGTPAIQRYNVATKNVVALTGPGYLSPSWSPDGRYVVASSTSTFGTDIVIIDGATGAELLRLTKDETSFAPVWSPAGDSIGFFRIDHGVVDLDVVHLGGTAPNWKADQPLAVTLSAGLDAASRPAWFVPPDQLPKPTPTASETVGSPGAP